MRTSNIDRTFRRSRRAAVMPLVTSVAIIMAATASMAAAATPLPVSQSSATASTEAPADNDVTLTVERELIRDDAVPFDGLDVTTANGIVTLNGWVDNLLARDRAIHIAQGVRGVRSVVDRIRVEPVSRTDGDIRLDVTRALSADPATDSYEIGVSAESGVVTLTGTVDSWMERELAGRASRGVKGVKRVNNDIKVDWKDARPDEEIAADVRAALRWDRLVDDGLLEVDVANGQVTLTGTVGSAAERERATAASWVSGVRSVTADGLDVAYWTRTDDMRADKYVRPADDDIARAIEDAMVFDPRVISVNVTPAVDRGIVTLRGTVANARAREAAVEAARNTVGVWRVMDHLKVRPVDGVDDTTLAARARQALGRDPYVDRLDVTVGVRNGVATLSGTVDAAYEKARAEDVVASLSGIVKVHNFLDVENRSSRLHYLPFTDAREPVRYRWFYLPSWTTKSDWEIAQDIRSELWWSPFVDADRVTVTVKDGVATLTGQVSTWRERHVASENAVEGGAISVINQIEVAHGPDSASSSP